MNLFQKQFNEKKTNVSMPLISLTSNKLIINSCFIDRENGTSIPRLMRTVGGVVEYAVDSVGFGDEGRVAQGIAEADSESGYCTSLRVGSRNNRERHQEGSQSTEQQ